MGSEEDELVRRDQHCEKVQRSTGSRQRLKEARVAETLAESITCEGATEVGGWRGPPS